MSFLCCFFKKKKNILGKRFQNILRNIWESISTCLAFYSQSSNSAHNIAFFFKKKKKSVFLNLFFQYSWSVGSKLIFWGCVVAKTLGLKLHWPEWKLTGLVYSLWRPDGVKMCNSSDVSSDSGAKKM